MINNTLNTTNNTGNAGNFMNPGPPNLVKNLATTFGVVSVLAIALNIIVIIYIFHMRSIRKNRPKAELFILSLAVADLLWAVQAGMFCLRVHSIIFLTSEKAIKTMMEFSMASSGMASLSTLFHAIAITVDRFLVMKYPLQHKTRVTRTKIIICICIIWILSAVGTSTQFWFPKTRWGVKIIDWIFTIGTIVASFCFFVTYSIMIAMSWRRKKLVRTMTCDVRKNQKEKSKKFHATVLSVCIVMAFVVCNLPYAIVTALFFAGSSFDIITSFSLFTILTFNTFLDPVLYSLVGILNKKQNSKRKRKRNMTLSTRYQDSNKYFTKKRILSSNMRTVIKFTPASTPMEMSAINNNHNSRYFGDKEYPAAVISKGFVFRGEMNLSQSAPVLLLSLTPISESTTDSFNGGETHSSETSPNSSRDLIMENMHSVNNGI